MKLNDEEQSMFERLKKKMDAPEARPTERSIRANIDLGDPAQIALARKLGFLDPEEEEEEKPSKGKGKGKGEEEEDEETPKRRGYFGN